MTTKKTKKARASTDDERRARGPRPPRFPAHLAMSPDEWRALKRQEWKEVESAFRRFQYGSAYVPGQAELWKLGALVSQMSVLLEGEWVAWL
jgi:hypothetical protein